MNEALSNFEETSETVVQNDVPPAKTGKVKLKGVKAESVKEGVKAKGKSKGKAAVKGAVKVAKSIVKVAKSASPVRTAKKAAKPAKPSTKLASKPKSPKPAKGKGAQSASTSSRTATASTGYSKATRNGKPVRSSWRSRTHMRSHQAKDATVLCQNQSQSTIWKRDLVSVAPGASTRKQVTCQRCLRVLQSQ